MDKIKLIVICLILFSTISCEKNNCIQTNKLEYLNKFNAEKFVVKYSEFGFDEYNLNTNTLIINNYDNFKFLTKEEKKVIEKEIIQKKLKNFLNEKEVIFLKSYFYSCSVNLIKQRKYFHETSYNGISKNTSLGFNSLIIYKSDSLYNVFHINKLYKNNDIPCEELKIVSFYSKLKYFLYKNENYKKILDSIIVKNKFIIL